eukprot:4263381-Amphidinium_carterae.2
MLERAKTYAALRPATRWSSRPSASRLLERRASEFDTKLCTETHFALRELILSELSQWSATDKFCSDNK